MSAGEKPFKGGPSFAPLYASKRSRDLPEQPDLLDARTLTGDERTSVGWAQWADLVIDYRAAPARDPLPADLDALDPQPMRWSSDAPGWGLEGWFWKVHRPDLTTDAAPDGLRDTVGVIRFTDPDGFRFALVVHQDQPDDRSRFPVGRFGILLPSMRNLFSSFDDHSRRRRWNDPTEPAQHPAHSLSTGSFTSPTTCYSLTALRDAVQDPDGWFGPGFDWRTSSIETVFRPLDPMRALLAWSIGGVTSYAEAEPWTLAGMDACETACWQALNDKFDDTLDADGQTVPPQVPDGYEPWTEEEMRTFFAAFGGGRRQRDSATRFRACGLEAEQAARWAPVLTTHNTRQIRRMVQGLEDAGWTPEDVTQMFRTLSAAVQRTPSIAAAWANSWAPSFDDVYAWSFVSSDRASAYAEAGIRPGEARDLERSGQAPDEATLAMMAALRPEPEPFF